MFAIYIEEYGYYEGEMYRNDGEIHPCAELQTVDLKPRCPKAKLSGTVAG